MTMGTRGVRAAAPRHVGRLQNEFEGHGVLERREHLCADGFEQLTDAALFIDAQPERQDVDEEPNQRLELDVRLGWKSWCRCRDRPCSYGDRA